MPTQPKCTQSNVPAEDNLTGFINRQNRFQTSALFKYVEHKRPMNDYYQIADCPWSTQALEPREEEVSSILKDSLTPTTNPLCNSSQPDTKK